MAVCPRSILAKSLRIEKVFLKSAIGLSILHYYGIREQFPEKIKQRSKPVYPILQKARHEKKKGVLDKDKLFVED